MTDIILFMQEQGQLFSQSWSDCYELHGQYGTNDLFIRTANQADFPTQPWQVRAAADMISNPQAEKAMKVYSCYMEAPSLDWLLRKVQVLDAMTSWCDVVKWAL